MNKNIIIHFVNGKVIEFVGEHLSDKEKPNWHYYRKDNGTIIHCRKEHMMCVSESTEE